jgi:hypothetical protein
MAGLAHLAAGAILVLAAWAIPRSVARAKLRFRAALALDVAPMAVGAALLLIASGRPIFAGVVLLALGAGLALADQTMRDTLHEPVVFSEMSELPQLFTHPHLYLPFAGPGLVIGGAGAAAALGIGLLVFEPHATTPQPLLALMLLVLVGIAFWNAGREPLLARAAALMRRLRPSGEPYADAASLGPFAMLLAHCTIARAERDGRRQALPAPRIVRAPAGPGSIAPRPIVIVQCESFFDARRLTPLVPPELLAGFEDCCASGARFGHVAVPGWGANTMRAEFAVMSGIAEAALGYDRFNPYHAFARVPIASEVWRLRLAGYRTICLHPFDRRFFRRDLTMPALGFEEFLGRESLGGARKPPYCPDPDLVPHILRVLDAEGPKTLIFAITMGNHGPWLDTGHPVDPDLARLFDPATTPQGGELARYLDGLRRSDAMLRLLLAGLRERGSEAVLGFYGDHLPSLPRAFSHFGFTQETSDYAIWPGGIWPGERPSERRDIAADRLLADIIDTLFARRA